MSKDGWPKARILPPNLNNNWMTAVISSCDRLNYSSIGWIQDLDRTVPALKGLAGAEISREFYQDL